VAAPRPHSPRAPHVPTSPAAPGHAQKRLPPCTSPTGRSADKRQVSGMHSVLAARQSAAQDCLRQTGPLRRRADRHICVTCRSIPAARDDTHKADLVVPRPANSGHGEPLVFGDRRYIAGSSGPCRSQGPSARRTGASGRHLHRSGGRSQQRRIGDQAHGNTVLPSRAVVCAEYCLTSDIRRYVRSGSRARQPSRRAGSSLLSRAADATCHSSSLGRAI